MPKARTPNLIVLSSDSTALRERYRAAFIEYIEGFHAMERSR